MFPASLVAPAVTLTGYWMAGGVVGFSYLLRHSAKLAAWLVAVSVICFCPSSAKAFMAAPGVCGSACMANWGMPRYPSPYFYPMNMNPYAFYGNPFSYYPMLPPWYGGMMNYPIIRGVQSVDPKSETEKIEN